MKNHRSGQAALLTESDCQKIRRQLQSDHHRLIWDIARWTGERWGAILKLLVHDVYRDDGAPHKTITFRAQIRKANPSGKRTTRQVPLHPELRESLRAYEAPSGGWLFPGMDSDRPLSLRAADAFLRSAVLEVGLAHKGISTHSTRVTFITQLHKKGVSERTIQQLTGHHDLKVLSRYIVISEDQAYEAIALL